MTTAPAPILYGPDGHALTPTAPQPTARATSPRAATGDWQPVTQQGNATIWEKPTAPTAEPAPAPAREAAAPVPTPTENAIVPEPTVSAPAAAPAEPTASLTQRLRTAGLWLRDTGLGGFGFALVLTVAFSGWAASFIGLHDFGHHHMGLTQHTAWLVPLTFDGAPAGLSIVVARASTHGRSAALWRILIIAFTGLSSWINYQHIQDPLGRTVASLMPPSAVVLFEGLMSEARAAAVRRMGRVAPRLHPLRWVFDRKGTLAIYRAYVLGLELPENLRTATVHPTGPDRTVSQVDRPMDRAAHDSPATSGPDRTTTRTAGPAEPGPVHPDRTAESGPDRTRSTTGPDRTERTAQPDRGPAVHTPRSTDHHADRAPAQRSTHAASPTGPSRTAQVDRTADEPLTLTDIEQEAVDRLRSTNRSISKRAIGEVVRTELGRSIGSDRAAEIARHYRTLRSA